MAPKLAFTHIRLTNDDGSEIVVPPRVAEIRRQFLAFSVLGFPGTNRNRWSRLIAGLAYARFLRCGCFWARGIVDVYNDIVDNPEDHGADSDPEFSEMLGGP